MHDTVYFETQGRPSVLLASTEFVDAAAAQSVALGLPEVRRVFVPHPIQDALDPEMWAKAEAAFEAVVAALLDA